MAGYPPGYRFCPTDEELITYYLKRKANSQELPCNIITDVDFYKFHPAELADKYKCENNTWYFFTPRNKKYKNGLRPDRAAGPGFWKASGAEKMIMDPKDKTSILGGKHVLNYYEGKQGNKNGTKGKEVNENRRKTNWIMHEYTIKQHQRGSNNRSDHQERKPDMKLDDWVLSKIYHRAPSKGKQVANGPSELDLDIDEEINALMGSDDDEYVDLTQPGPSNVWCPPMQLNGLENGNDGFFNQDQPGPSNLGSLPIQPNGLGNSNDEFIDQTQPWLLYPSYPTMQPLPYQAQPEPLNLGCPPMQPSGLNESSTFLAMSQPDPMNLTGLSTFMENDGSLLQPTGLPSDRFEGIQPLMQSSQEMDHLANCYPSISDHFDCLRPVPPPVMSPQQQSSFNEALLQWDLNIQRQLPMKPNSNLSHLNI